MTPLLGLQLLTVALCLSGAIVATIGARRIRRGAALQRGAASIESQLARPPVEVIGEVRRGVELQRTGLRIVRRGFALAAGGFAVATALLLWQLWS